MKLIARVVTVLVALSIVAAPVMAAKHTKSTKKPAAHAKTTKSSKMTKTPKKTS